MQHLRLKIVVLAVLTAASNAVKAHEAFLSAASTPASNAQRPDFPLFGANFVIVAAHHDEDLAWLDTFAQHCKDCHVYLYTSSRKLAESTFQHGTIREVPNVGREWGKYLRFISDEYQALQQTNATVVFIHAHGNGNGADDDDRGDVAEQLFRWPSIAANHILFLHGGEVSMPVGTPDPVDYGGWTRSLWPTLFHELGPVPNISGRSLDLYGISSAEFSVPAKQIVHRSLPFYRHLEEWLLTEQPALPAMPHSSKHLQPVTFTYAAGSVLEVLAYRIFQGIDRLPVDLPGNEVFVSPEILRSSELL